MIDVYNKMTAIADNTRILSGTSDKLKLDDIDTNLDAVVEETDTQYEILQQIKNALVGKGSLARNEDTGTDSEVKLVPVSDEDILEFIIDMGYVNPIVTDSNKVFTDNNNNNIYILY